MPEHAPSTFRPTVRDSFCEMMQVAHRLTVLLLKEGSQWVAQCLEHDLAGQGPDIDDALESFSTVLTATILLDARAGRRPLSTCGPAPVEYFALAKKAKHLQSPAPWRLPDDVPPPWMRVVESDLLVV